MRLATILLLVTALGGACHHAQPETTDPKASPAGSDATAYGSDGTLTAQECKELGGETTPDDKCPMKLMCSRTDQQGKHSTCVMKPDPPPPSTP